MIPTTRAAWASDGRLASDDESTVSMEPPSLDGEDGLAQGTMLGEYQVERTLARGGMGTVFAAVHPLIGKRVAIKVLSRALCSDPASVQRFVDEARVVNRIGHPNIVDVFAFGAMPDGRQYLVMELLQGETLGARMARAPVPLAEACAVMKQLARALGAAHAHGVIHRDLKPDNVFLVTVDGGSMVKLLDFGIAKLSHQDAVTRTAAGALVGTPQYIAPEQARGGRVDAHSDIYAFGGLLFELLAGRPVFLVNGVTEAIAKHLLEAAPRLSQFAQVPDELDDLVAAMLAKNPAVRPTLDRICDVLDRAAAAPPPLAPSAPAVASTAPAVARPAVPMVARPRRSRLRSVAPLAAALAVMAVALAWAYTARPHAEPAPDPRDPTSASATPSRSAAATPQGAEAAPAAPPETLIPPSGAPAAVASPPDVTAVAPPVAPPTPSPEAPAAVPPPSEAPAARRVVTASAGPSAATEPTGASPAAEATGPASDAARAEPGAATGDGKPRGQPMPRTRARHTGRLELAIRGAHSYVVVVDGVAQGARSELALPPGPHTIEVRAAGELPRRFTVQIEPGKTTQRDVAWTHDAPPPAPTVTVTTPAPAPAPPVTDDHALMGPGEALPRETPRK
jgi:serine/threonine-protein kinase